MEFRVLKEVIKLMDTAHELSHRNKDSFGKELQNVPDVFKWVYVRLNYIVQKEFEALEEEKRNDEIFTSCK